MNILVTNDDGIFAPGVEAMVDVLQHFGTVYVVCPDQERSAISHSITLRQPLKAKAAANFLSHVKAWTVNGTPADCVKLGIEVLMKKKPDFVFSGINLGPNLGRDVYYSGTMAGAAEASLYNIPSAAVSLNVLSEQNVRYATVKELFYEVVETILKNKIPKEMFLNINLPYLSKEMCKGVKVVPLDLHVSRYRYVGLNDPHGQIFYWLKDELNQFIEFNEGGDFKYLREGYITVSPIELKTQYKKMAQIQRWFQQFQKNEISRIEESTKIYINQ